MTVLFNNFHLLPTVSERLQHTTTELPRDKVESQINVLGPVVKKVDNAIRRINLYPVDSAIGLIPNTDPLNHDLSMDSAIRRSNNRV